MDLTDYPNLGAIFDGRVSRAHDEWPQVRVELRRLLDAAADLERRLVTITKVIQMHQPVGSPPPGDEAMLAAWVLNTLESRLALWKEGADSMKAAWHAACHDIARLEEEKAQALEGEHYYKTTGNMWAETCAQAEVREAEMRRVLDVFWRDRVKLNLPLDYQAMLPEVLSPDVARAPDYDPLEYRDVR